MYAKNFGLTQDPFSIAPDPRFLFMSERHREALAHLLYGVAGSDGRGIGAGGGFVLLTGEIGTGKTTICRCFLEQIPAHCHIAYIFNPKLTVAELLQSICEEFHITTPPAVHRAGVKHYVDALNTFLLQSHAAGHNCVLIIDEAQNLSPDVLEQLRLLTNLETNERKLLQIVLIGQPELRTMLERPQLEQLAQRVIARFHLDALNATESTDYIAHRLAVAGYTGPLPFDARALQRIHTLARGVPRRINLLCGRALLGAWANGLRRINRTVINQAAAEVFGPERTRAPRRNVHRAAYALLGLALLTGVSLAGLRVWMPGKTTPPSSRVVAPASAAAWAPASAPSAMPGSASAAAAASATAPTSGPASASASAAVAGNALAPVITPLPGMADVELSQLPSDMNIAWRELGSFWKLPAVDGDACQVASLQQLQCFRAKQLTLPQLRQLGRPGILTLHPDEQTPVYAVLVGLTEQTALLRTPSGLRSIRLVRLGSLWRGDFATYWQPPPAYTPNLRDGSKGPAVDQLARQLATIEGIPQPTSSKKAKPQRLDNALRARVAAFQRAQGLEPDGQPGPLTFMQIERAAGQPVPGLQTEPR
jgi:general secretion pathway protein A